MNDASAFFSRHALKLTGLLMLGFIAWYYSPVLFHPDAFIFSDSGDAIKNYFCYEWHVHHDPSFIDYTGSNYPFGEHHGYTDGNPLLANFLRIFSFLKPYSIALFDLSILFSFVLCALLLFKIFRMFGVHALLTVIAAVGITILCPQVFRMGGHFALSYNFFIPLSIYLLMMYERSAQKLRYSVFISLAVLCFFFIHPYLGMISSAFVILYWIIRSVAEFSTLISVIFHFFMQAVLPPLLFLLYTKLTDSHTGRPSEPYGFLYFTSSIETVFISTRPPFRHFLSQIYEIKGQTWEGIAYIGITSLATLIAIPVLLLRKGGRVRAHLSGNADSRVLLRMGIAAFLLLLFSMGYPFKWGMESLVDDLPLIRQFRCPGRFAWVFYFIATILSVVLISRYFLSRQHKYIRLTSNALLLLLFTVEGIPYHEVQANNMFVTNCFDPERTEQELRDVIAAAGMSKADALIPLPFFHIGTDYYDHPATEKIKRAANIVSFHSQLPLMANHTARVSLTEAEELIAGVLGNGLLEKRLRWSLGRNKKLLMLYSKEILTGEETALLEKGRKVCETSGYALMEISSEELFHDKRPGQLAYFAKYKPVMQRQAGHYLSDTSFFDFDGSRRTGHPGEELLIKAVRGLKADVLYELSFWYDPQKGGDINNTLNIKKKLKENGREEVIASRNIMSMPDIADGCILAVLRFQVSDPEAECRVFLSGNKASGAAYEIRDVMIREAGTDVYMEKNADTLIINNIPVTL